ncbi:salicylate hydroxylase [Stereum hirsutum FP-91666 SS1]|uniref:salicylate hydroxylase n=1 Tax=Stereum hirsutum (strain FP-91666) TaxID=721885 RepID=UPI000440D8EF|nr:salicylate hydroxylase [Stereum hirsutum FP-91666 SS1]EIM88732.1 salicylate hydroxylase [Stereum hirsutum FP-91666 SS1]
MATPSPKFRVAVCGGGIGGIVAAYALGRHPDIDVDIYEAASQFGAIGAGIAVIQRSWTVLKMLGLEPALLPLIKTPPLDDIVPHIYAYKSDQPELGENFVTITSRGALLPFTLKTEFHQALIGCLSQRVRTHTSKRLVSYEETDSSEPIKLYFKDGSTATCDILIGADGIKSIVRVSMYEKLSKEAAQQGDHARADELLDVMNAKYSGATVYRTLIPGERLKAVSPDHRSFASPIHYLGKNHFTVTYPVARGQFINAAIFETDYSKEGQLYTDPWVSADIDSKSLITVFENWESSTRELVECIDGLTVSKWAVNVVPSLPTFVSSRVALLGDAAHAMTPFQGAGAGQAIEDAYILSTLLAHPFITRANIPIALEIYSRIRLPFAYMVFERSRRMGGYFSFYDPENPDMESRAWNLEELGKDMQKCADWQLESALPKAEKDRAVNMLESELS